MAAHPGYSATNLQSRTESVQDFAMGVLNKVIAQGPAMGAQPTLYAATVPDLPGGTFIGPSGFQEIAGPPVPGRVDRGLARPRGAGPALGPRRRAHRRHAAHPRRRTALSTPAADEAPLAVLRRVVDDDVPLAPVHAAVHARLTAIEPGRADTAARARR